MPNTLQLGLPLVQPSQAQKHVTVNEALARIDALAHLRVVSDVQTSPPASPADGEAYIVPTGATDDWAGAEGQIALFANGGWIFIAPQAGWQALVVPSQAARTFDGSVWRDGRGQFSPNAGGLTEQVIEADHVIAAGAISQSGVILPAGSRVTGAAARVLDVVTGVGMTGWRLGIAGDDALLGSGHLPDADAVATAFADMPSTLIAPTELILTAEGGDFASGTIRLAVFFQSLHAPNTN